MSARPTTNTNGYSGMSAARVTEAQTSSTQRQNSFLVVMSNFPAVMYRDSGFAKDSKHETATFR